MTEREFIQAHEHEFLGMIFDAMTSTRQGGEASLFQRHMASKIRVRLAAIYQQLRAVPAVNGQPGPLAGKEARKP